MPRKRQRRRHMAEINVVPYIDVMLVLLVIFMITAPLLTQGVHVNLPTAQAKTLDNKDSSPIVVSVKADGSYYVNTEKHPETVMSDAALQTQIAALLDAAKSHHLTRDVYVKGDKDARYGQVVHAMALLQDAGVADVGLITREESK